MQTYIVSFASFLVIGITMRLIHSGSVQLSTSPLIAAAFILVAAIISFAYRSRILAFLLLCTAICVFMLALPADPALDLAIMGCFIGLFLVSIFLGVIKQKPLPVWMLSALILGYGLTRLHLDTSSPHHLVHWAGDDRDTQSVVYGIIVKEPEVRPENNDTRLTIEPSLVVKVDKHPQGRQTLKAINAELSSLGREWASEEEALLTLIKVRDRLDRDPKADPEDVIVNAFARGDYTPSESDVERIKMALEEAGTPDPELGWIGRINRGWLLCVVLDADDNREEVYPAVSQYQAYGNTVRITAPVETPPTSSNPGGFDYRAYLISVNTFATSRIRGRENWTTKESDTIEIIREDRGNPAIYACMSIKYDLLEIIRQTTPFPESGFLSGIFIGLRQGVPDKIVKDSQAAGTAHVFAVSGLHVTIIAGLLLLIFNQTPIPKSIWAPIAVIFLVVFTIITGGRPSTLRAATMNSFVLIFFTYFGKNIQKSLVMAICFAAIVIICFLPPGYGGPLILPSASFLMSFSAVLFLGLLSGPAEDFFNYKLNNLHSLVTAAAVVVWIGLLFMNLGNPWGIFRARLFWGFLIAIPVAFLIQQVIPFKPAFRKIPGRWLRTFIAAQAAIQCSIVPLSMVIFHRMSLAAPFANFIAIPLIGVILPLGMIATLIGFIPVIGIQIALLISAANWLGMNFFIRMDDFFARTFPYPQMPKPTAGPLIAFYLIVAFFIYREKIVLTLKIAFVRVKSSLSDSGCRLRAGAALATLLIASAALTTGFITSQTPEMKVIIFSLGWKDGMAALVQTPTGENILIDGGSEEWDFYRDSYSYLNQGQRTVEEVLLGERVVSFEAVISSNPDPRVLGGLNYIVGSDDYYVKRLYTSLPTSQFGPQDLNLDRFSIALSLRERKRASHWYRILLLNQIEPMEAIDFMEYFRQIPENQLTEAISQLPPGSSQRHDPRVITEKAIQTLEKKEAAAYEELINSITSTRKWLYPEQEITPAEARALADRWDFQLLPAEEYLGFVANLPQQIQWLVYQEAGVVDDTVELIAYRMELYDKFVAAMGFESDSPSDTLFRGEETFLQYHRFLFAAKRKNIPLLAASQGIEILSPKKIRGYELKATILNPGREPIKGKYISNVNSVVLRVSYGETSFLFSSLLDTDGFGNLAQNVRQEDFESTIFLAPQFGKGGRYFDQIPPIQLIKPEAVIFQYPGGAFGREDKNFTSAWEFCSAQEIEAYNTKEMGAVIVYLDGDSYRIETSLEKSSEESESGS